jgi:hypothetical protein
MPCTPAHPSHDPAPSLLIAALALISRRCPHNTSRATLLLQCAALCLTLTDDERDICAHLADELAFSA